MPQYEVMKGQLQKVEESIDTGSFQFLDIWLNNTKFDGKLPDHAALKANIGKWYEFEYEVKGQYKKLKSAKLIDKPREGATPLPVDLREKAIQLETCSSNASTVVAAMINASPDVLDTGAICKLLHIISEERWEWLQSHLKG